jgi:hypothetical protein
MMEKRIWLILVSLCALAVSMAGCGGGSDGGGSENPPTPAAITWEKTLGGTANDTAGQVLLTDDGGYIVVGTTSSFGAGGSDVYLVKLDAEGNVLWEKTYGAEDDEQGRSIARTTDGGYIITGSAYSSPGLLNEHVYLIKIDGAGNTVWRRTYDEFNGRAAFVLQTSDNGYVLTGSASELDPPYPFLLVLKLDASGDIAWKTITGAGLGGWGNSIDQTKAGDYVVTGHWEGYPFGGTTRAIVFAKLSANGDIILQKELGSFFGDVGTSIKETADGGYIVAGAESSENGDGFGVYLAEVNTDGDVVWKSNYGSTTNDIGNSVQQTGDGGYIVAGATYVSGNGDVYLIKTDGQGELLWEKTFGGAGDDVGMSVLQAADGGYMIAGYTNSFGAGGSDIYLIKTDGDGNVQ